MSPFYMGLLCGIFIGVVLGIFVLALLIMANKDPQKMRQELITDGYAFWSKRCHECGRDSMEVVRPGKVQCAYCD